MDWDDKTKNKTKLDMARVKIWGYSTLQINETIPISIEGKEFNIRIIKESTVVGPDADEDSESTSWCSEVFPEKAAWIGDDIGSADGGHTNGEVMIWGGSHEEDLVGDGTEAKAERLGSVRVEGYLEKDRKAADPSGRDSFGTADGKEVNEERREFSGSEDSLEFPPGWGPIDKPNGSREVTEICKKLRGPKKDKRKAEQAKKGSVNFLQSPPGWGPTSGPVESRKELANCETNKFDQDRKSTQKSHSNIPRLGPGLRTQSKKP